MRHDLRLRAAKRAEGCGSSADCRRLVNTFHVKLKRIHLGLDFGVEYVGVVVQNSPSQLQVLLLLDGDLAVHQLKMPCQRYESLMQTTQAN